MPISYLQAIILGLLQGVTQLFRLQPRPQRHPAEPLAGTSIRTTPYFLSFLVATHLATAIVLLSFFWHDWVRIIRGHRTQPARPQIAADDDDARLGWLLVVGTIPAGILGLLLEHPLRQVFASPTSAAFFLILNGLMLFGAELLRRARRRRLRRTTTRGSRERSLAGRSRRLRAGDRAHPGFLAVRRDDGRRPPRRPLERGRSTVRLPARDTDHRRRRGPEAPRAVRPSGGRRSRPGPRRRALLGAHRVPRGALPDALLRDEPPHAVRDLLPRRRRR